MKKIEKLDDGRWMATDVDSTLYIKFEEGAFNKSQECGFILPPIDPIVAPRLLRELTEWLNTNHLDKLI